jgi:hypothetical protein
VTALETLLELDKSDLQAVREYGFAEIVLEFAKTAREFDPGLSAEDIYQASRNVWSMNFMQLLVGQPVRMTPAIFAYSLLYPYSDNYLDDPAVPLETKLAFNRRFRQLVSGERIPPANAHEAILADLVARIEGQYDPVAYPQVYESLLAIHQAQNRSLGLMKPGASPYEIDVLGISFEKGGTSVLADGYLVAGSLTGGQQEAMYYYGVFTQLMDDLEDILPDLREGRLTIYSQSAGRWPLDAVTNRTIHFGRGLLDSLDGHGGPESAAFKRLIRRCINPLLIASAGEGGRFYSRAYLRELEAHSPVRFAFLSRQRKKLARLRLSLNDLLEVYTAYGQL